MAELANLAWTTSCTECGYQHDLIRQNYHVGRQWAFETFGVEEWAYLVDRSSHAYELGPDDKVIYYSAQD